MPTGIQWSESGRDPDSDAIRALRSFLTHLSNETDGAVMPSLADEFRWVGALPDSDRQKFVTEFADVFQSCAELGQWAPLDQAIREWRNTAAVHAYPELAAALAQPIEYGVV